MASCSYFVVARVLSSTVLTVSLKSMLHPTSSARLLSVFSTIFRVFSVYIFFIEVFSLTEKRKDYVFSVLWFGKLSVSSSVPIIFCSLFPIIFVLTFLRPTILT